MLMRFNMTGGAGKSSGALTRHLPVIIGILVGLAIAPAGRASLLVEETFDYALGDSLVNQAGGVGWNGAWRTQDVSLVTQIVPGLVFNGVATSGQAVKITQNGSKADHAVSRALGVSVAPGETLWSSYLFSGTNGGNQDVFEARLNTAQFGNYNSASFRCLAKRYSSTYGSVGYDNTEPTLSAGAAITGGDTYLLLARFTNVGNAGGGQATMWAFNQTQFDALLLDDAVTSGELDAITSVGYMFKAVDTLAGNTPVFDTTRWAQLVLYPNAGSSSISATFDELRYGVGADPILAGVVVPEPATFGLALLGLGALGAVHRRRRLCAGRG